MALTMVHHSIISHLLDNNVVSPDDIESICEIGEQNWFYGNLQDNFVPILKERAPQIAANWQATLARYTSKEKPEADSFDIAQIYYEAMFGEFDYTALDMHGTARSTKTDLNLEYQSDKQFDLVTNLGTTEHIFNQAQVFKTIHEITRADGYMYHALPHQGQYDHGFYNYHPTFFIDLAAANSYKVELIAVICKDSNQQTLINLLDSPASYHALVANSQISNQAGLHAVFRKTANTDFVVPMQGYYQDNPDASVAEFWRQYSRGGAQS